MTNLSPKKSRNLADYSSARTAIILLLFLISMLSLLGASAQGDPAPTPENKFDFIPASPNAKALGEYGANPVDLSNGAVNVNIPIYTFKAKDISVPISMSYRTTGIKVDQVESWLGLGWVLNAGGVISRTIMDEPDERSIPALRGIVKRPEGDVDIFKWKDYEYAVQELIRDDFDTQPDEYNYNFMGYSGKFIFSDNGDVITIPKEKFKIEWNIGSTGSGEIIITGSGGIKYHFGGEGYEEKSFITQSCNNASYQNTNTSHQVNSWYLSQIEHPSGAVVNFEYELVSYTYDLGIETSITRNVSDTGGCPPGLYDDTDQGCQTKDLKCKSIFNMHEGVLLSSISSPGYGSIEFDIQPTTIRPHLLYGINVFDDLKSLHKSFKVEYDEISPQTAYDNLDYFEGVRNRFFLSKMSELDPEKPGNVVSAHSFEYYGLDSIPPRLSYSRDFMGYFNGKANTDILPTSLDPIFVNEPLATADLRPDIRFAKAGALRQINYPTGGHSSFTYESHTEYGQAIDVIEYEPKVLQGDFDEELENLVAEDFTSPVDQEITFYLLLMPQSSDATTTLATTFRLINSATGQDVFEETIMEVEPGKTIDFSKAIKVQLEENVSYRAEIDMGTGYNVTARMSWGYASQATNAYTNVDIPGIRISSMTDDPGNDLPPVIKSYDYSRFGSQISSGWQRFKPSFESNKAYMYDLVCYALVPDLAPPSYIRNYISTVRICHQKKLSSNSVLPITNNGGAHVTYSNVTTRFGGVSAPYGKEEVDFLISPDYKATRVYGDRIDNLPLSNGWGKNLVRAHRIYEKSTSGLEKDMPLVQATTNHYSEDESGLQDQTILVVEKEYHPNAIAFRSFPCNDDTRTEKLEYLTCTADHAHDWAISAFSTRSNGIICTKDDAVNEVKEYIRNPCSGNTDDFVRRGDYYGIMNVAKYNRTSHWVYMNSSRVVQYDDKGDSLVTTHQYSYDNPEHLQLSTYTMTDSKGRTITESHYYPEDYDNTIGYNLKGLIENNVSVPIKTERIVNGEQVSGNVFTYNEWGKPLQQYQFRSANPLPSQDHVPTTYLPSLYELTQEWRYNNDLNVVEHHLKDNMSTTFLWGYGGALPVAKIDNATYDEVVDNLELEWESNDYGNLSESDINALRTGLPDAFITIFTHHILDGVTSITNPDGKTERYYYKNGRFDRAYDDEGNIVQKVEYNFSSSTNE